MKQPRWAVFISGKGSNLAAILSANDYGTHPVGLVVSNKANCLGVFKARRAGIPVYIMKKNDWSELQDQLAKHQIQRIFLAGFMRILPADFVNFWRGSMLNIHPSLLPLFQGLKSIERAWIEQTDIGITVHEVIAEVDSGKHVLQRVAVAKKNLPAELKQCEFIVHINEHRLVRRSLARWRPSA